MKDEVQAKITELKEYLDNKTNKLHKANWKILRIGRKVTIQAPDREDSKRENILSWII